MTPPKRSNRHPLLHAQVKLMCLEAVAIESTFGLDACKALKALALSQTQGYLERVAHVLSMRQVSSAGVRRFFVESWVTGMGSQVGASVRQVSSAGI